MAISRSKAEKATAIEEEYKYKDEIAQIIDSNREKSGAVIRVLQQVQGVMEEIAGQAAVKLEEVLDLIDDHDRQRAQERRIGYHQCA